MTPIKGYILGIESTIVIILLFVYYLVQWNKLYIL